MGSWWAVVGSGQEPCCLCTVRTNPACQVRVCAACVLVFTAAQSPAPGMVCRSVLEGGAPLHAHQPRLRTAEHAVCPVRKRRHPAPSQEGRLRAGLGNCWRCPAREVPTLGRRTIKAPAERRFLCVETGAQEVSAAAYTASTHAPVRWWWWWWWWLVVLPDGGCAVVLLGCSLALVGARRCFTLARGLCMARG